MRPIKLTMSAFGSYSGMETIDLRKFKAGCFSLPAIPEPEKQRSSMR